ncbi:hypothetical protein D1BOALGB6SA_7638 [Olavius sp. associated proteobacterium Delta 1]|nr:hypothetical protein D1BOALGB6SA_7638 [Olavius sp. associated proteobacterium Delta 1]
MIAKGNVKEKIKRLGKIQILNRSHELTRKLFSKESWASFRPGGRTSFSILEKIVPLILTIAIIRGYSCQFVANNFLKG